MRVGRVGLLVLVAMAGCLGAGTDGHRDAAAQEAVAGLSFEGVFDVFPDAMEPEDQRGKIQVEWRGGRFAIDNEKEWDLASHTLIEGGTAYTSRTGTAWTSWSVADAVAGGRQSNRLMLWDVPALLAHPDTALRLEDGTLHASLHHDLGTRDVEIEAEIAFEGDRPTSVVVRSPQGRESPFTIAPAPAGTTLRFPLELPTRVLPAAEVDAGNAVALEAHDLLARLVTSYCRTRAGLVPDSVDAETLRVEMVAAGASWPTGAYDGQPMRDDGASGHFTWERTSPTQGTYTGMGWDGGLALHHFGPVQCSP